ncbi:hypothetical protein [Sphingomonas sp. DC1100-1]|uniref:hypothetical protein n=1 Tax=unclassified Sphingomonas TaxID=196159 RepID=UPI003CE92737
MSVDGIDFAQAELIFERLGKLAEALADGAGVGECETVGHIVSYLLDHPRDIEPFLRFGFDELPLDWIDKGRLSHYATNGKVVRPEQVRRARIIKNLERSV